MSLADIFGDYDFSDYSDSSDYFDEFAAPSSSVDFFDIGTGSFFDQIGGDGTPMQLDDPSLEQYGLAESGYDPQLEARGGSGFYEIQEDERSLAKQAQDFLFRNLGVGEETAKAISAFAKAVNRGGGRQAQAQGRGRVGPGLPSSARAPTSQAGRTSRARQATSGERAVQAAISQSNRAQSAARAIANQMARAGTVTTTNDLADMISGATSPKGTKQALPGTRLRQLASPRTA